MEKTTGVRTISAVGFLSMLGFSLGNMLHPLYANSLGMDPTYIGLAFFFSNITSAVFRIPIGITSDLYGRKWLISLGSGFWALSGFLLIMFESIEMLLVSLIFWGIGAAFYFPTTNALIADVATPEVMTKTFGTVGVFQTSGNIVGPLLGGFIADNLGISESFIITLVSCLAASLVSSRLPDPRTKQRQKPRLKDNVKALIQSESARLVRIFAFLYVVHGLYAGMYWTILPLYLTETYNMDFSRIGFINTASMLGGVIGSYVVAHLPREFRLKKIAMVSTLIVAFLTLGYILITVPSIFFVISFFIGLFVSFGTFGPVGNTMFLGSLSSSTRGVASGITGTSWRGGLSGGSLLLGAAWTVYGMCSVFIFSASFLLAELIVLWLGTD